MATVSQSIGRAGSSIARGITIAADRKRREAAETQRLLNAREAAQLKRNQTLQDREQQGLDIENFILQATGRGAPDAPQIKDVLAERVDARQTEGERFIENPNAVRQTTIINGVAFTPTMAKLFGKATASNPAAGAQLLNFMKTADESKLAAVAKINDQNAKVSTLLNSAKNLSEMNFMIDNILETRPNLNPKQREELLKIKNDPNLETRKIRLRTSISQSSAGKDLLTEHRAIAKEVRTQDRAEVGRGREAALGILANVRNQTDPGVQVQMLEQGVADLKAQGLDARPLERIVNHPQRTLRLNNLISGTIGAIQPAGVTTAQLKPVTGRGADFATSPAVTIVNPDGSISIAVPVTDKRTGETIINNVPIAGDIIDKKFGETAEQFQQRKVETVRQSEVAKLGAQTTAVAEIAKQEVQARGAAKRVQKNINTGLERASLIPVINRSLELMEIVETGGFAAAKLRGKQLLGIESADEAELFFNLQKSVVSQLKKTFGAAFTKQEGDLLGRIEAGFGKSTAGNIRLLNQTIKFLMIDVKRGLRSARGAGDKEAAQEIQDLIDLKLTPEVEGTPPTPETTTGAPETTAPATEFSTMSVDELLNF